MIRRDTDIAAALRQRHRYEALRHGQRGFFTLPGGMGAARPSGELPLLDLYPGAVAAYSISRKLISGATVAFRARWNANANFSDVAFTGGGDTDSAALSAAVGASTATVETLYDWSGNMAHLHQGTIGDRPVVINAGTLQTEGGKICATFDATDWLDSFDDAPNFGTELGLAGNATFSIFAVHKKTTNTAGCLLGWGDTGTALAASGLYDDGSAALYAFAGGNSFVTTVPANNTYYLTSVIKTAGQIGTTTTVRRNGASVAISGHSTNTPNIDGNRRFYLGQWANFASNKFQGTVQELIIYASDQSANLAGIEANINAYYSIF